MNILPNYAKDDPMEALCILKDVADALGAVLGSADRDLLDPPDVRAGFSHIAYAMRDSLESVSHLVRSRTQNARELEKERDQAKAAALTAERRYECLKFVVEYNDAERAREEAGAQVPDLTESVPITDGDIAAAG
ncbi:hypothetical protein ACT6QH_04070 [Xanthobacter sp. TB0139]|uniref:hypothetical protein n=1 Tax=Xanthobacter sp. TB0139 TaxID=3459178 RepID=UPI00403A21A6